MPYIDENVVSMRFDNRQFEEGAAQSMSTLDKLKEKLKFKGADEGLNNIADSARRLSFDSLTYQISQVTAGFSTLEIMAISALSNIANRITNMGINMVKSLSVDNISAGWSKYEQKTANVQTLINSTGKSIDEVNKYLDKLMWFSDETSYGFTDMTSALSTMASAGGELEDLIPLLEGVANATAFAGKGASEYSRVMSYSVKQAYSLGYMGLQDWKTIQVAGVGSKQLIETFIKYGNELGTISATGAGTVTAQNFTSTLSKKWLTKEVMERAFGEFAEVTEKAYEMIQNGEAETATQAYEKLSKTYGGIALAAAKAAQEAKSFSEVIASVKDAVSSKWLTSFEYIFGNYEEAKTEWTKLANSLWEVFAEPADHRNSELKRWKEELDGRTKMLDSLWRVYDNIIELSAAAKQGFRSIFTGDSNKRTDGLFSAEGFDSFWDVINNISDSFSIVANRQDKIDAISKYLSEDMSRVINIDELGLDLDYNKWNEYLSEGNIEDILDAYKMSKPVADDIYDTFNGIGSAIRVLLTPLSTFVKTLPDSKIFVSIMNIFAKVVEITGEIGRRITTFANNMDTEKFVDFWTRLDNAIFEFSKNLNLDPIRDFFFNIGDTIGNAFTKFNTWREKLDTSKLVNFLVSVKDSLMSLVSTIMSYIKPAWEWMKKNINLENALKVIKMYAKGEIALGIGKTALSFGNLVKNFGNLGKTLNSLGEKIQNGGIIGLFMNKGTQSDAEKAGSVAARGLNSIAEAINNLTSKTKVISLVAIAGSLIMISGAIHELGSMPFEKVCQGLIGVGAALAILLKGFDVLSKNALSDTKSINKTALSMIVLGAALKTFSSTIKSLGDIDAETLTKGLIAIGALLAEVAVFGNNYAPKESGWKSIGTSISTLITALAIKKIVEPLKELGMMDTNILIKGLSAIGVLFIEIGALSNMMSATGGIGAVFNAVSILIIANTMDTIINALRKITKLNYTKLSTAIVSLTGIFTVLAGTLTVMSKVGKGWNLISAVSIKIMVSTLDDIVTFLESMKNIKNMDVVGKSIFSLVGVLGTLSAIAGLLGSTLKGWALISAASIKIMLSSLHLIPEYLGSFADASWGSIIKGVISLLTVMGSISAAMIMVGVIMEYNPVASLLGEFGMIAVMKALDDVAEYFVKISEVPWKGILKGFAAMASAFALIGGLGYLSASNPLIMLGEVVSAISVNTMAKGISTLGDAFIKFSSADHGLAVFGRMLGTLAAVGIGGLIATLGTLGAPAVSWIADGMSKMADAFLKWSGVSKLPEGIIGQIAGLGAAVLTFSLDHAAALAISMAAEPLGTLGEALGKWKDVDIPDGLVDKLGTVSSAIQKLTFAGSGAENISKVAEPLGTLAESLKTWSEDITVAENMGAILTDVGNAINMFTAEINPSLSLSYAARPLNELADAVRNWKDLSDSETGDTGIAAYIETTLSSIGNGFKELDMFSGLKIWGVSDPMSTLLNAISSLSYNITSFADVDIGSVFGNLSKGIKENLSLDKEHTREQVTLIKDIKNAIENLNDVAFENVETILDTLKGFNSLNISSTLIENAISADAENAKAEVDEFVRYTKTQLDGMNLYSAVPGSSSTSASAVSTAASSFNGSKSSGTGNTNNTNTTINNYSVNGVSYTENTNVSKAIKELVTVANVRKRIGG